MNPTPPKCHHVWHQLKDGGHICLVCNEKRKAPTAEMIVVNILRKMTSGNDIQIERTTLTRREFAEWGEPE
jgi:hypothetical protein